MTTQPSDPAVTTQERRHAQRRKYRGNIEIDWGSNVLEANVRDIGPGGLFAELMPPLWVGATFNARLLVDPVLLLQCTVARVDPAQGIAVIFRVTEDRGKVQLESLLQSLPTV
jgi:hypothetical protein